MTTRHEAVRLEFIDDSSAGVLRAAAAYAVLDKAIDSIDGKTIRVSLADLGNETDRLSKSAVRGSSSIDQFSGRLGILAKAAAVLGPALIPLGGVGAAGVAGLANQFGFAAVAAGTAMVAFQGMGDALGAVQKAAIEPSVANLEKAQAAMEALSPAGRSLVAQLQEMAPLFTSLRDSTQEAMFPGVIEGLQELERLAPGVEAILKTVGQALGDIFADGAKSLASSRWADFFAMLAIEARPTLMDMASAIGSVVHGLSEMWEAFAPLNRSFGSWLKDAAADFDRWAQGLSETEGFREFVEYIQQTGPKVADAIGSIANALVQIVQAAAPIAGPVLDAISGLADALAAIADSPLGTPIFALAAAMSAMSLAASAGTAAVTRLNTALLATGTAGTAAGKGLAAVSGGPAGIAAFVGLSNLTDGLENFKMILTGDRGIVEGLGRAAAGFSPFGQAAELLGYDIFGVNKEVTEFGTYLANLPTLTEKVGTGLSHTREEARRFGDAFFGANKELLRNARQAEVLREQIQKSNQAIRESASAWSDYSQKVQLGDTSLETIMDRMRKLAEASRDMAENIRKAIDLGVNGDQIRDLIDRFGQQGAALALQELANSGKDTRKEFERLFGSMKSGEAQVRQAMRGAEESVTGLRDRARELDRQKISPKVSLDDRDFRGGVVSAESLLTGLHRRKPAKPKADLDISGVQSGVASVNRLLTGLNGDTAHTYVVTHLRTVRDGNDTAGGPPALSNIGADGATVPKTGRPYADRHPYLLADGEEVISNRYGQADRHRQLLKAINANRLADGGSVFTTPRSSDLTGGISNGAFGALNTELERLTERFRRATRQLRMMEKALERQEKAIDKQREVVNDAAQAIEDTLQKMVAFGDDISGRLTKGLFEGGSDFASIIGTLQGNQTAGNQWMQSLFALQQAGLDGPALQALLQQATGEQLAGVAGWTPEQIAQFEALFGSSTAATSGAGSFSSQLVFGAELAENRAIAAASERHLADLVDDFRDAKKALKAQEKYIEWLERRKDKVEQREKDNHENHAKTAKALTGVGDKNRSK